MLIYDLKKILTLVPDLADMVKQANLEEEFPTDSKDSVCASYARAEYLIHNQGKYVDPDVYGKITKAAYLYNVKDDLDEKLKPVIRPELQKSAQETLLEKLALFEENAYFFHQPHKAAHLAKELINSTQREDVLRYGGQAYLNKEAAVASLARRYQTTGSAQYVKLAHTAVEKVEENDFVKVAKLSEMVTDLDRLNGLDVLGFDFYKEALVTHPSSLGGNVIVVLAGKKIPFSAIRQFGPEKINSVLGSSMNLNLDDPFETKAALEALPMDSQTLLRHVVPC